MVLFALIIVNSGGFRGGARGGRPSFFRATRGPKGRKKFFGDRGPALFKGLDDPSHYLKGQDPALVGSEAQQTSLSYMFLLAFFSAKRPIALLSFFELIDQ